MKNFVLVHHYCETGFNSIVAFSDNYLDLQDVRNSHPRFGSSRHNFYIFPNIYNFLEVFNGDCVLKDIKDSSLINICKNVSEYLAVGEYSMLKKSYFKASAWFEKAKNSASLGADIIENY